MVVYEEENCWLYYMLRENLVNYDSNAVPVVIFNFHTKATMM
jgi:hypothetical protein